MNSTLLNETLLLWPYKEYWLNATLYQSHLLGFYCPEQKTCLIPCPLGAYCRQSRLQHKHLLPKQGVNRKLCNSMGMCCVSWQDKLKDPIEVTLGNGTKVFKCPGMPHPYACPKGNYCPDTAIKVICKSGYYCPQGSIKPLKCPVRSSRC